MIIGPGRTPWMNIAASSTAAGAEPGTASVSTGMMAPGTAALLPVSAACSPRVALAEALGRPAGAARRGVGDPGAHVLADAGDDAHHVPIALSAASATSGRASRGGGRMRRAGVATIS
jgi:hypothetical protein